MPRSDLYGANFPSAEMPSDVPVLSAGRHRSPRRGACFMEYASWLAGETWSDHPACTHPALASLARLVNDCSQASARSELAVMIPSVIGLTDDDPRVDLLVAIRASCAALPVACEDRQRALAAGLLCCERYLEATGGMGAWERALIASAFTKAPGAAAWAREFSAGEGTPKSRAIPRICEAALRVSVIGIAEACVSDPDARLRELLATVIDDFRARVQPAVERVPERELVR